MSLWSTTDTARMCTSPQCSFQSPTVILSSNTLKSSPPHQYSWVLNCLKRSLANRKHFSGSILPVPSRKTWLRASTKLERPSAPTNSQLSPFSPLLEMPASRLTVTAKLLEKLSSAHLIQISTRTQVRLAIPRTSQLVKMSSMKPLDSFACIKKAVKKCGMIIIFNSQTIAHISLSTTNNAVQPFWRISRVWIQIRLKLASLANKLNIPFSQAWQIETSNLRSSNGLQWPSMICCTRVISMDTALLKLFAIHWNPLMITAIRSSILIILPSKSNKITNQVTPRLCGRFSWSSLVSSFSSSWWPSHTRKLWREKFPKTWINRWTLWFLSTSLSTNPEARAIVIKANCEKQQINRIDKHNV